MIKSFSLSLSSSRFVLKCLFPCISLSLVQYLCVICAFCCAVPPHLRTAAVFLAQHGSEAFVPSLAQFTVNTDRWTCLCCCCLSVHSEVCVCVCMCVCVCACSVYRPPAQRPSLSGRYVSLSMWAAAYSLINTLCLCVSLDYTKS